jgi:hypothetical protein
MYIRGGCEELKRIQIEDLKKAKEMLMGLGVKEVKTFFIDMSKKLTEVV